MNLSVPRPNGRQQTAARHRVKLFDESLRDGLQGCYVKTPSVRQKKEFLHYMEELGIEAANIGMPFSGESAFNDVVELAREIRKHGLAVRPWCLARTQESDVESIARASRKAGIPIGVQLIVGASPARRKVEGWTRRDVMEFTENGIRHVQREKLPLIYLVEHSTQTEPKFLSSLWQAAMRLGARRICVADTNGSAVPEIAEWYVRLLAWVAKETLPRVKRFEIQWHGHNDRGLALANSLAAARAGASWIDAAILGVGERAGNTALETLMLHFVKEKYPGYKDRDITRITDYGNHAARACRVPISKNHPILGADVYDSNAGFHAAAIAKALNQGRPDLAETVYTGFPPSMVGRKVGLKVGPNSGKHNATHVLNELGVEPSEANCNLLLQRAKNGSKKILSNAEILETLRQAE